MNRIKRVDNTKETSPIMFYKYSVKCCKDAIIALSLQLRLFFYFIEK